SDLHRHRTPEPPVRASGEIARRAVGENRSRAWHRGDASRRAAGGTVAGLIEGDAAEADVSILVDRLVNRLGVRRVYRAAAVESDVPDSAHRAAEPAIGGR